jgi:hypothetical protein
VDENELMQMSDEDAEYASHLTPDLYYKWLEDYRARTQPATT